MPKNWADKTSTTITDYEALEAREFIGPQFAAAKDITDETFTVSDTLCHSLQFIPRGNLTSTNSLEVRTAPSGGGTLLVCTAITGALASGQVRVRHGTGKLEFHADQENAVLYATYKTRISNIDEATMALIYNRLRAVEVRAGVAAETYVAGEDVVEGPGYISGNLVYQANPDTLTKCGYVWIVADASLGNNATIYRTGQVTPRRAMPANTPIYTGHGGDVTWEGDVQQTACLQDNEYHHCIGVSDDGITLNLNTVQDARRQ